MEDKVYKTVRVEGSAETEVKGSRFFAVVFRVVSREEFKHRLLDVKAEHATATHNCWAFRIGSSPIEELSSDDGEPAGTAGLPILRVLAGKGFVNSACVVTRYFGGTKLGVGGLIRAYSQSASAAIKSAEVIDFEERSRYFTEIHYKIYAEFEALMLRLGGKAINTEFGTGVSLYFEIPKIHEAEIIEALRDLSAGKACIERILNEG